MDRKEEIEQLSGVLRGMGSSEAGARTMAAQLSKRADQLSKERNVTREAALQYLMELVAKGRSGDTGGSFLGEASS